MELTLQEKLMLCLSQPVVCCGDDGEDCLCTIDLNEKSSNIDDDTLYLSFEI